LLRLRSLRRRELQQLNGVEVLHAGAVDDQIAAAEVAKGDRQRVEGNLLVTGGAGMSTVAN
jgi:hypothetical protein